MAANVEALLGPRLWRGHAGCSTQAVLPTGFAALDEALGGGWPWGAMIEIFVPRYGSGELALLMPALASLCRRSEAEPGWIVWISPPLIPYAPALVRHGVAVERMLIVHARRASSRRDDDALWATEQALRSDASAAVLAWLASASNTELRRLQLAAEERRTGLVLFRPVGALSVRSPAALRLKVAAEGGGTRIDILKLRGGRPKTLVLNGSPAAMHHHGALAKAP